MQKEYKISYKKPIFFLFILTIIISFLSLFVGYYSLTISDIFSVIFSKEALDKNASSIILNLRLPRIISALLIGMALSVSGSAYQGMFKNPLVSPDILGVSSGASAGASIAIVMGKSLEIIQLFAFLGGLIAVLISYSISLKARHSQTLALVLTGTMIGSLASSFVSFLKFISNPNDSLIQITFWLMGSLNGMKFYNIKLCLFPMTIGFLLIFFNRFKLNLLMLSDNEAKSLGINPKKTKFIIILASTLLSASAVCLGGLIGWVGLIIPHITRFIFGANYQNVIPASAILGGLFLLIVDTLARSFWSVEVPLGILTSLIGVPFFLILILFKNNSIVKE